MAPGTTTERGASPAAQGPREGRVAGPMTCLLPAVRGRAFAVAAILVAFAATVLLGCLSEGSYHADDITHHRFASYAWRDPRYLLDTWGRPGFTAIYAPLAWMGHFGSRLTSAILSAAAAWFAYLACVRLGFRRAYLAPVLLYGQWLFTQLSFTSLTETPLALYLALALYLWVTDRPVWSAAAISVGAVTRHEACVWLGVWGLALLVRMVKEGFLRRNRWAILRCVGAGLALLWAPAVHNVLAHAVLDVWPFRTYLKTDGDVSFGRGTPLHYVVEWMGVSGPVMLLGLVGLAALARQHRGGVVVLAVAAYFLAETVIYTFGKYSSGGYGRFLVPLCPAVAVAGVAALEAVLERRGSTALAGALSVLVGLVLVLAVDAERAHLLGLGQESLVNWYWPEFTLATVTGWSAAGMGGLVVILRLARATAGAWAALETAAITLILLSLLLTARQTAPYRLRPVEQGLKEAAAVVRERFPDRPIVHFNPWFPYFANRFYRWGTSMGKRWQIEAAPVGTILVWDSDLAPTDYFRITEHWLRLNPWLQEVWSWPAEGGSGGWPEYAGCVRIYEKVEMPPEPEQPLSLPGRG